MRIRRNIKQYFIIELFQSLRIKIMITAYNNNIYGIAVCSAVYIVTFRIELSVTLLLKIFYYLYHVLLHIVL